MEDQVLKYVKEFIEEHGYSPTIREIRDSCGISSTSVVATYLGTLERRQLITMEAGKPRTIRVKENGNEGVL